MGEIKALKRPNGDHITQSKYLDFLVETARKDRAAPRPPLCPTTKPAGMAPAATNGTPGSSDPFNSRSTLPSTAKAAA